MKSFYEFWREIDRHRRIMEFNVAPGAGGVASGGTSQGGGFDAANAGKTPMPAQTASQGMSKPTDNKGVGPSIGTDPLEPISRAKEDLEDAVKKAKEYTKATQGNPPAQLAQIDQLIQQLDTLMGQMGHDKDANDQKKDTQEKDQKADQDRSNANMTAQGPPQIKAPGPGGGLGTDQPSPGAQGPA